VTWAGNFVTAQEEQDMSDGQVWQLWHPALDDEEVDDVLSRCNAPLFEKGGTAYSQFAEVVDFAADHGLPLPFEARMIEE
jgi:hypothetical protein